MKIKCLKRRKLCVITYDLPEWRNADSLVLETSVERRIGSNPILGTKYNDAVD